GEDSRSQTTCAESGPDRAGLPVSRCCRPGPSLPVWVWAAFFVRPLEVVQYSPLSPSHCSYELDVKKVFRDSHDVLQIQQPSQNHLDWKCCHSQQQEHHDVKPNGSQGRVESLKPLFRKQ